MTHPAIPEACPPGEGTPLTPGTKDGAPDPAHQCRTASAPIQSIPEDSRLTRHAVQRLTRSVAYYLIVHVIPG